MASRLLFGWPMLAARERSMWRTQTTVLVVEDDDDLRELVSDTLRRDGFVVLSASSAEEADQILRRRAAHVATRVDLVLSDVQMGGPTGLDLVRRLRCGGETIPLILMTAFPDPDVHDEALRLHATILAKPFRLEGLRRAVLTTIATYVKSLA